MSKSALGRGLGALLEGSPAAGKSAVPAVPKGGNAPSRPPAAGAGAAVAPADAGQQVHLIRLEKIISSPLQPRKEFAGEALKELADSIRSQGVIQPLIVRRRGSEFELIAGERRWRAAKLAGLMEVPVVLKEADDSSALQMMLIENLQRADLNPIEEALGYDQLGGLFNFRQEDIAAHVGKSRVAVANALRLLKLPGEVQNWIRAGQLSAGHAKVILGLEQPEYQKLAAAEVIKGGLSVRATEDFVARFQAPKAPVTSDKTDRPAVAVPKDVHVADLENRLQSHFGTKVQLRYRKGKGTVTLHFFNDDELNRLLDIFSVKVD